MEPVAGIEPASEPYKGSVLPLNETGLVELVGIAPTATTLQESSPP